MPFSVFRVQVLGKSRVLTVELLLFYIALVTTYGIVSLLGEIAGHEKLRDSQRKVT